MRVVSGQSKMALARVSFRLFAALFLVAAHCGLRCGEACGLHWQDVNLKNRSITDTPLPRA